MTTHRTGHKPRRPRVLKSPKQRAEEALALAQNAHDSALRHRDAAKAMLQAAEERYGGALARLEHRKADPDLRADQPTLPVGEPDTCPGGC